MSEQPDQPAFVPPVSTFGGPVAELIAHRMLQPPSRPGLLAMLGQYEILRILGRGGMGTVLLARDPDKRREVAVKLINYELATDQNLVHRFLKEAGHLKRLQHPNIVPVLEISDSEIPYFVMPYFEKGSLSNRIRPGQPLDATTILDITSQVAHGLSFAHRSGIIHRDLKPVNILLDSNGQAFIADFGLARTLFNDTVVEVENRPMEGTAPYMSPAVAAGEAEDTRCDIYSFGAVLYEMLTGHPPYKARTTKETLSQIIAGPPRSIASLNPNADRGLAAVADKAMARELRDRYADMRDVLEDLNLMQAGRSPSALQKTVGSSRRASHLTLISVALAVAALLAWVFWHRRAPAIPKAPPPPPTPIVHAAPLSATITTLAGQPGVGGFADGPAGQAQFHLPNDLAVDKSGNVFVADTANNVIRKIAPDGNVTTLAGSPGTAGSTDGSRANARFSAPFGITVDNSGNVFVADTLNNVVRKITPDGVVTTLAGMAGAAGSADGNAGQARFRNPWGVAVDAAGNVFVADMSNDTIRKISPDGSVTTVAGQAGTAGSSDGPGSTATFNGPFAIAANNSGDIYVADSGNNTIRRISPNGVVTTLAGAPEQAGLADRPGNQARFANPQGLAVDSDGNIFVADSGNSVIRKITAGGQVTTVQIPANQEQTARFFNNPDGVAVDSANNLYVADTVDHCIRKLVLSQK